MTSYFHLETCPVCDRFYKIWESHCKKYKCDKALEAKKIKEEREQRIAKLEKDYLIQLRREKPDLFSDLSIKTCHYCKLKNPNCPYCVALRKPQKPCGYCKRSKFGTCTKHNVFVIQDKIKQIRQSL